MDKQQLLDYANNMDEDEEVFAIIYSKDDVVQRLRDEAHAENRSVPELLDDDIYDALRGWSDNMDLSLSWNLADAFADLCDDLVKEHLAKGK
jgi:hypothetical protein